MRANPKVCASCMACHGNKRIGERIKLIRCHYNPAIEGYLEEVPKECIRRGM